MTNVMVPGLLAGGNHPVTVDIPIHAFPHQYQHFCRQHLNSGSKDDPGDERTLGFSLHHRLQGLHHGPGHHRDHHRMIILTIMIMITIMITITITTMGDQSSDGPDLLRTFPQLAATPTTHSLGVRVSLLGGFPRRDWCQEASEFPWSVHLAQGAVWK